MKTLTKITLMSAALSVIVHMYLAYHYYPIKFGFSSGPSICSINATFDCDAVAASRYSAFMDVPMALWGVATNLIIFLMVLGQWWGMSEHPERLRRWALVLILISFAASITMGLISLQLHNYCLFCILAYVLSILSFACYRRTLEEPFFANLSRDIASLWSESKGIVFGFIAIPILAFVGHRMLLEAYGVTEVGKIVQSTIQEWQTAPHVDFSVSPALTAGPSREQAKLVISEFADFRCHHCKNLIRVSIISPKVILKFAWNFITSRSMANAMNTVPCNKTGISCRLAYSVQCATKQSLGWELHHALYDDQDTINGTAITMTSLDAEIKKVAEGLKLNTDELFQCMSDPATLDAVRMQAKQGISAKIEGTPSIFANGRLLNRGQLIPVMDAALEGSSAPAK